MSQVEKVCDGCGKRFAVKRSAAARRRCCSRTCADAVKSRENRVEQHCKNCGKAFSAQASRTKHGRGVVCSKKCQYELVAKLNRQSGGAQAFTCLNCKKEFRLVASRLKLRVGVGKYCCRSCRNAHRVGENHPQTIDGSSGEKRGPNWQAKKREAKRRDGYRCQDCGISEVDFIAMCGERLHVHHVVPYRLFASYQEANQLKNLKTLCPVCHRKADAEIQRIERGARNIAECQRELFEAAACG